MLLHRTAQLKLNFNSGRSSSYRDVHCFLPDRLWQYQYPFGLMITLWIVVQTIHVQISLFFTTKIIHDFQRLTILKTSVNCHHNMRLLFNPFYSSFKHPKYTREQLRNVARILKIPRGQNTKDTVDNLRKAGVIVWTLNKPHPSSRNLGSPWILPAPTVKVGVASLLNRFTLPIVFFQHRFGTCSSVKPRAVGMLPATSNSRLAGNTHGHITCMTQVCQTFSVMVQRWNKLSWILSRNTLSRFTERRLTMFKHSVSFH